MVEIITVGNITYYLIDKVLVAYAKINNPYQSISDSTTQIL